MLNLRIFLILCLLSFVCYSDGIAQTWKELQMKADSLAVRMQMDSAIAVEWQVLKAAIAENGERDSTVARTLCVLGDYHTRVSDFSTAKSMYDSSYSIAKQCYGENGYFIGHILQRIGVIESDFLGDYQSAQKSFECALEIFQNNYGENHAFSASVNTNLADLFLEQGIFSEAESHYLKAIKILERIKDPNPRYLIGTLSNLGGMYQWQGRLADAEAVFKRGIELCDTNNAEQLYMLGVLLGNLGTIYEEPGEFQAAESLYTEAASLLERTVGSDNQDYLHILKSLARIYDSKAQYSLSGPIFHKVLEAYTMIYGPDHAEVAWVLQDYADHCMQQNRYDEAEGYLKKSLEITRNTLPEDHPENLSRLRGLAICYSAKGKYEEADSLYYYCLQLEESAFGDENIRIVWTLQGLAQVNHKMHNYDTAASYYSRAIEIVAKSMGTKDPDLARQIGGLASVYRDIGKFSEADSMYEQALQIIRKTFGNIHPEASNFLVARSGLHRLTDDYQTALADAMEAFQIRMSLFLNNVNVMAEQEALLYAEHVRSAADNFISCFYDVSDSEYNFADSLHIVIASTKGLVTNEFTERDQRAMKTLDSNSLAIRQLIRRAKFKRSRYFFSSNMSTSNEKIKSEIDSLDAVISKLEKDLALASEDVAFVRTPDQIGVKQLTELLPPSSALIEYMRYTWYDPKPSEPTDRYLVSVIGSDGQLAALDIGSAAHIDSLVSEYRAHLDSIQNVGHFPSNSEPYYAVAKALYAAIIGPIRSNIEDVELLIFAPDAALNLISFAGLVDENNQYLIEDFTVHYLAAGRDLTLLKDSTKNSGLLAMGDPDFNATVSDRIVSINSLLYAAASNADQSHTRNIKSVCGDINELIFNPLPASREEIQRIAEKWSEANSDSLILFVGSNATEDAFKLQSAGKRVIHLATHGYYLERNCNSDISDADSILEVRSVGENPLMLSGLVFAGCNHHGEACDSAGIDDGILSAYEVSALDLTGTDLVVLSACETGVGKVERGEGVYGLRRAFQMAGARMLVSALWPVDDRRTAEMMAIFYTESDKSIPERMREMQLSQINKLRAQGLSDHPYSWAGFIAIGDWK